jgi:hypothetical protein
MRLVTALQCVWPLFCTAMAICCFCMVFVRAMPAVFSGQ